MAVSVPNFITQALNGDDLTVYGDGSQTRSFCYVGDLVNVLYDLSQKDGINGEVYNTGNPDEYKINDFAKIIQEKLNIKSKNNLSRSSSR